MPRILGPAGSCLPATGNIELSVRVFYRSVSTVLVLYLLDSAAGAINQTLPCCCKQCQFSFKATESINQNAYVIISQQKKTLVILGSVSELVY